MTDHTAEMKKINDTSSGTGFMPEPIKEARWKRPLCPYLMTGNHRILMHLDAFLIPQSFQWPSPGAPERIGKRNLCDEWPYWREMPQAEIALQMPGFEYEDAHIETLDSATDVAVGYLPDSNVLRGFYRLPGGMELAETLLVHSDSDCWVPFFQPGVQSTKDQPGAFSRNPSSFTCDSIPKSIFLTYGIRDRTQGELRCHRT